MSATPRRSVSEGLVTGRPLSRSPSLGPQLVVSTSSLDEQIVAATQARDIHLGVVTAASRVVLRVLKLLEYERLTAQEAADLNARLDAANKSLETAEQLLGAAAKHLDELLARRQPHTKPSVLSSRPPSRSPELLWVGDDLIPSQPSVEPTADFLFEAPSGPASDSSKPNAVPSGPAVSVLPSHDPTPSSRIFTALQPTPEAVSQALKQHDRRPLDLAKLAVFLADGKCVAEQPKGSDPSMPRTVSTLTGQVAALYAPRGVRIVERIKLSSIQLPAVYCSSVCEMDLAYVYEVGGVRRVLSVQEYKAPSVVPLAAVGQAVKYACAAAAGLCQVGLDAEDVIVPLLVSNGHQEVHGAAYMATPTLPLAILISNTLNMDQDADVAMAHQLRAKSMAQMDLTARLLLDKKAKLQAFRSAVGLGPRRVPLFRPGFLSAHIWAKWGVFSSKPSEGPHALLFHMFRVFRALFASSAAQFVCFPFGYAAGIVDAASKHKMSPALLFPNLCAAGYQCHLPQDPSVAAKYMAALKEAVAAMHAAGVVHGDLYVSNVMWRLSEDGATVLVKIIDWDTAFLAHDGVPSDWKKLWEKKDKWQVYQKRLAEGEVDSVAVRALDLFMLNSLEHCMSRPELMPLWTMACDTTLDMMQLNTASIDMHEAYTKDMRASSVADEAGPCQMTTAPSRPPVVGQKRPFSADG